MAGERWQEKNMFTCDKKGESDGSALIPTALPLSHGVLTYIWQWESACFSGSSYFGPPPLSAYISLKAVFLQLPYSIIHHLFVC